MAADELSRRAEADPTLDAKSRAVLTAWLRRGLQNVDIVAAGKLQAELEQSPQAMRRFGKLPIKVAPQTLRMLQAEKRAAASQPQLRGPARTVSRPRERRARAARSPGSSRDDPSEPPLTKPCSCGCGRSFLMNGNGRPRQYFENACRQRAWQAARLTKPPARELAAATNGHAPANGGRPPLSREQREWLKREISRHAIERLSDPRVLERL